MTQEQKIIRAKVGLLELAKQLGIDYNYRRPNQGRWCFGKTPMQTLLDALLLAKEKLMAA
jgi:hypothetical protein